MLLVGEKLIKIAKNDKFLRNGQKLSKILKICQMSEMGKTDLK